MECEHPLYNLMCNEDLGSFQKSTYALLLSKNVSGVIFNSGNFFLIESHYTVSFSHVENRGYMQKEHYQYCE